MRTGSDNIRKIEITDERISAEKLLFEFCESGSAVGIIERYPHKTAAGLSASLKNAKKRTRTSHIEITVRKGKVYLFNHLYI